MVIMGLLGFSSGLPLPLTSGTLQAYLTLSGVKLELIGLFTLSGLPYTLKFLWAPLLDRFFPPILTRRRGWIFLSQVLLIFTIFSLSFIDPKKGPALLLAITIFLAFLSSSQDIVVDAYRTDSLSSDERGPGASVFILGYRTAMLLSGAASLVIADRLGWDFTFLFLSLSLLVGVSGTLFGEEKNLPPQRKAPIKEWVIKPLAEMVKIEKAYLILAFIVLYKLGDAYLGAMTVPYLIGRVGFSATEVGMMMKAIGILCTMLGALFGGLLMVRISLWSALFHFGLLQMFSNLTFILLSIYGKNHFLLLLCVAIENISGGMGTSAFLAFLMSLCRREYSATQFAILSSLSAFGRILISPTSGFVASSLGWIPFFFISSALAFPGLMVLYWIKGILEKERQDLPLPN